jgi:hypothetical protein
MHNDLFKTKAISFLQMICFTAGLLFIIPNANAQENKAEGKLLENDMIEGAAERVDNADISIDTYQENLTFLLQNPININKAGYLELRNCNLFSEIQIRDLLKHIEAFGPLLNIYELQTIASFSTEDINRIKPFIRLAGTSINSVPFAEKLYLGDYQYFFRISRYLEVQDGFIEDSTGATSYAGDNHRIYSRFRYNYQNMLSYGITMEKDAGEAIGGPTQPYGFDYYSMHFFKKSTGVLKSIALGDYEIRIGQGLVMWSGFGIGKSVYPVSIRRAGPVLDSYTSTNENRYMRGAGVTVGLRDWQLTAFGSYKAIDANVSLIDTVADEVIEISSIDESGLHRSESELERKNAINETIGGFDLTYYKGQFNVGVAGVYYRLSSPLAADTDPYAYYNFSGSTLFNTSLHYNYLWRNLLFFGETAASDNMKVATVNGIVLPVDPKVDIALLYRYFSPEYQSLYAATFSEGTIPQNEQGTYLGIEVKPIRAWKMSAYIDVYKHPWLEFRTDAPTYGTDFLGQIAWQPSRAFETYVRFKHEISDRNMSGDYLEDDPTLAVITNLEKTNIRWHADYDVSKSLTLKSRVEFTLYDENAGFPEKGYLAFQDFNYHPMGKPFSFATRFAIFNTDSYNSRIYAYETEVLYAYSIIGLSGKGSRAYLLVTYSPFKWLDIWARVSNTWYSGEEEIGSGDNTFPGATRSDVKLQCRVKW